MALQGKALASIIWGTVSALVGTVLPGHWLFALFIATYESIDSLHQSLLNSSYRNRVLVRYVDAVQDKSLAGKMIRQEGDMWHHMFRIDTPALQDPVLGERIEVLLLDKEE